MSYRTIIVDDEPPALAKLSHLLKDHDEFELAGAFNNAEDALNSAKNLKPQVAFVDIAMPGKNGMELAASLRENLSSPIEIIFVTAFDQYAVSAFDIDATDYLLKPVSKERFLRSIQRIKNNLKNTPATPPQSPAFPTQPMVHAFGKLEITGIQKAQPEWRTAKVRELFALFLKNRSHGIFRKALLDILWENLPEEKALSSLNTCNYYLRQFLKASGTDISLNYKSGYYSLDLGHVICDSDLFEQAEQRSASLSAENISQILYGASLYRGRYFEDVKCGWAALLRDQYDIRYANLRVAIARYYASDRQLEESCNQVTLALNINPLCENAWRILLQNYREAADNTHYDTTWQNRQNAYQKRGLTPPELVI